MTDLQGAWLFTTLLIMVVAMLDAVIQGFALHAALARGKVHAPEVAGLGLLLLWAPTIAVWLGVGMYLGGRSTPARCTTADVSAMWLAALYLLTAWPAPWLARSKGVRLGGWYWATQIATAGTLFVLAGFSCL